MRWSWAIPGEPPCHQGPHKGSMRVRVTEGVVTVNQRLELRALKMEMEPRAAGCERLWRQEKAGSRFAPRLRTLTCRSESRCLGVLSDRLRSWLEQPQNCPGPRGHR